MPRKKRREKFGPSAVSERPKPRPTVVSAAPAGEMRSIFCPVCWTSHGRRRLTYPKGTYSPPETDNFWEQEDRYPDGAPFGIIQEVGRGKGYSFKVLGYFGPEDDEDGSFELVKARLLSAVKKWLKNGWLTRREVEALLHGE